MSFFVLGGSAPALRLVDLFDTACVAADGHAARARHILAAHGLHPMRGPAAARMLAKPGLVYDASAPDAHLPDAHLPVAHLAVLSFDDGTCGTVAEDADPGSALAELASRMKARGVTVSPVGSAPAGQAQLYRLRGPAVRLTLMLALRPDGALTRVSMLAEPDG